MKLGIVADEISRDFATAVAIGKQAGLHRYEIRNLKSGRVPLCDPAELDEVDRICTERDVEITAISPGLFKLVNDEAGFVHAMSEVYPRAAEWAYRWRLPGLIVFGFLKPTMAARVVEWFAKAAQRAATDGLTLMIEPEPICFVDTSQTAASVIEQTGATNLRINYDPGNVAWFWNRDPIEEFACAANFISNVHIKDLRVCNPPEFVPAGEGMIDYRAHFAALREAGYVGPVSLEPHMDGSLQTIVRCKGAVERYIMKFTRREALEVVATAAVAAVAMEQTSSAQPANSIGLHWLDGEAPSRSAGVSWGVPFARGTVAKSQNFVLTAGGNALPLQQWPLAFWPDGSMKFVGFATVLPAGAPGGAPADLRLARGEFAVKNPVIKVQQDARSIEIDTGVLQCSVNKQGPDFIASMKLGGKEIARQGRLLCTLENRSSVGSIRFDEFVSEIKSAIVEQNGPVRSVVKIDGVHKAEQGSREWLPFTVRLYFYAGQSDVRMVHTIVFDGDQEKDFIRGLGVSFAVPMREQMHNRHVQFTGDDRGVWAEPLQPATGRRPLTAPGVTGNLFAEQLLGKRRPNKESFPAAGQKLLTDWAIWDSYKLVQPTADGFVIQKRTNPESCWLDAAWGRRATGLAFVGDVSGGLSVGLKNVWQSHPTSLEVRGGSTAAADLRVWLWSPDAPAMDLRHYDTKAHDLDSSYEDVQPGFSTPHGVARTSELMLFPSASVPSHEDAARQAKLSQQPPLLMASPEYIHSAKVFGIWSLPNRSTAARTAMEDRLEAAFALYHKEVEQRHWYGFWNYGDVMHAHDGPRHQWRYDIGGFAWDNTELGTDVWLWYQFLRSGRGDAFRMAEAMTRHTSEVDTYHLGRFQGLGSRHNVRHWGCGAKESRISQAAYRRFYYYLTTDERTGDLMRAVVDIDYKLLELDPMRLASPVVPGQNPYPARVRGGPDWLAFVGNWMTEWERTGETKYRDKIIAGMDSIAAMPYGFLTGPDQLYGYDPKNGKMIPLIQDGYGVYNLTTIMGGAEVVFELNELIDHAGWRKAWKEYCLLTRAPKDVGARGRSTGNEGLAGEHAQFGRCAGYVYLESKNVALAKKAWTLVRVPTYAATHLEGPAVLGPIDEVTGVTTNTTAQGCLEAIELLEMCGEHLS